MLCFSHSGFSLGHLHMGGTSAGGQSVNGGTHEGGHRPYGGGGGGLTLINKKKRSHTQLDSRKQVIAFQDRVITISIKEAQHPLKREKQVIDKSSIMLKISTKSMHRVLV